MQQRPLRELVGKLSLEQAKQLVFNELEARKGPKAKLDRPSRVMAEASDAGKAAATRSKWIKLVSERHTQGMPLEEAALQSVQELLRLLRSNGQRPPTVHEMAAVMAYHHGLGRQSLIGPLLQMLSMEKRHKRADNGFGTSHQWTGISSGLFRCLKFDLPERIEKALFETPKIMHRDEIAEKLSIEKGSREYGAINYAMQLLEQMNLVHKEFPVTAKRGGSMATWVHSQHGGLPVEHEYLPLHLLKAIYSSREKLVSIMTLHKPGRQNPGNPLAQYSFTNVYKQIAFLQGNGLVEKQMRLMPGTRGTKAIAIKKRTAWVKLTPLGNEVMDEFNRNGGKSFDRLRTLLLLRVSELSKTREKT